MAYVAQNFHFPDSREWQDEAVMPSHVGMGSSITCNGFSAQAGFRVIVGSGPAGPVGIAFPFILIVDENALKVG